MYSPCDLWQVIDDRFHTTVLARIPPIFLACLRWIDAYGLETEGLFRCPGDARLVKELRLRFELLPTAKIRKDEVNTHTVCSLLVSYLGEGSEGLLSQSLQQRFLDAAGMKVVWISAEAIHE